MRRRDPRIAIIGCGFGGITVAAKLLDAGIKSFTIFDSNDGPGGTWWSNDYPGCEVDVPSGVYSLSFQRWDWARTHARQPELLEYIRATVCRLGLEPHIVFGTRVTEARWDDSSHTYTLVTAAGDVHEFDVVVSAVGLLSNPYKPDWPGLAEFRGPAFHSAEWDHSVDLSDKVVAVVGVGSTATQVVPAIAPVTKRVLVFQREPGWVLPKGDRDYSPFERRWYRSPIGYRLRRWSQWLRIERAMTTGQIFRPGTKQSAIGEKTALAYIDKVFAGRPDLKELVTPRYAFSGKRRVVSDDFYPALLRDDVELIPNAVERVTTDGVVDAGGVEHKADVLVMATGFTAARFLASIEVYGTGGRSLRETWGDSPYGLLGLAVPGFPNFYMMYGPNTNGGGPIVAMHELQAKYIVRDVRRLRRNPGAALTVSSAITEHYNVWLQRRLADTAWAQANNYMKSPSGKIVTQWPEGTLLYAVLLRLLRLPATKVLEPHSAEVAERSQSRVEWPSDPVSGLCVACAQLRSKLSRAGGDFMGAERPQ